MVTALHRISDRLLCHSAAIFLTCAEKCARPNNKKLAQRGVLVLFERIRKEVPRRTQRSPKCHELLRQVNVKLGIQSR